MAGDLAHSDEAEDAISEGRQCVMKATRFTWALPGSAVLIISVGGKNNACESHDAESNIKDALQKKIEPYCDWLTTVLLVLKVAVAIVEVEVVVRWRYY